MALDQAANFVREQVTSAISAGDTTINVADASPFPVPPEGYNIVVWDGAAYVRPDQDPDVEIMRVTDTDTTNDTLTVARGQEGTSDVSHPDTSVVVVAQTAKMIADIASEKISNPVTETVNVDGNDVTNVGALDAEQATIGGQRDSDGFEQIDATTFGSSGTWSFDVSDLAGYDTDGSVLKLRVWAYNNAAITADFHNGAATYNYVFTDGASGSGSSITVSNPGGGSNNFIGEFLFSPTGYFVLTGDSVLTDNSGDPDPSVETARSGDQNISSVSVSGENNFSGSYASVELLGRDAANW